MESVSILLTGLPPGPVSSLSGTGPRSEGVVELGVSDILRCKLEKLKQYKNCLLVIDLKGSPEVRISTLRSLIRRLRNVFILLTNPQALKDRSPRGEMLKGWRPGAGSALAHVYALITKSLRPAAVLIFAKGQTLPRDVKKSSHNLIYSWKDILIKIRSKDKPKIEGTEIKRSKQDRKKVKNRIMREDRIGTSVEKELVLRNELQELTQEEASDVRVNALADTKKSFTSRLLSVPKLLGSMLSQPRRRKVTKTKQEQVRKKPSGSKPQSRRFAQINKKPTSPERMEADKVFLKTTGAVFKTKVGAGGGKAPRKKKKMRGKPAGIDEENAKIKTVAAEASLLQNLSKEKKREDIDYQTKLDTGRGSRRHSELPERKPSSQSRTSNISVPPIEDIMDGGDDFAEFSYSSVSSVQKTNLPSLPPAPDRLPDLTHSSFDSSIPSPPSFPPISKPQISSRTGIPPPPSGGLPPPRGGPLPPSGGPPPPPQESFLPNLDSQIPPPPGLRIPGFGDGAESNLLPISTKERPEVSDKDGLAVVAEEDDDSHSSGRENEENDFLDENDLFKYDMKVDGNKIGQQIESGYEMVDFDDIEFLEVISRGNKQLDKTYNVLLSADMKDIERKVSVDDNRRRRTSGYDNLKSQFVQAESEDYNFFQSQDVERISEKAKPSTVQTSSGYDVLKVDDMTPSDAKKSETSEKESDFPREKPEVSQQKLKKPKPVIDRVRFSVSAPPTVAPNTQFSIDLWGYIRSKHIEVVQAMEAKKHKEKGASDKFYRVERGVAITAVLNLPPELSILGNKSKTVKWLGEKCSWEYPVLCTSSARVGSRLECQAKILIKFGVVDIRFWLEVDNVSSTASQSELATEQVKKPLRNHQISDSQLKLVKKIGEGAFGEVFLAELESSKVVVKYLKGYKYSGSESDSDKGKTASLDDFQAEMALCQLLGEHPNVCTFRGSVVEKNKRGIVTSFYENRSIEDYIKECHKTKPTSASKQGTRLTTRQKLQIARDSCSGLWHIHQSGVLHRDFAARNCLLDSGLRSHVTDFGLSVLKHAAAVDHVQTDTTQLLPFKSMAPESIQYGIFNEKSDAWMAGTMIWELFTEKKPFADKGARDAGNYVVAGGTLPISKSGDIPEGVGTLMKSCFKHSPRERVSVEEVVHGLDKMLVST